MPWESNAKFLNLDTIDFLSWIILCFGGCLVHCGMFSSIPGLYQSKPEVPSQLR